MPSTNTSMYGSKACWLSSNSAKVYPVQSQISLSGHSVFTRCTSCNTADKLAGCIGSPPESDNPRRLIRVSFKSAMILSSISWV
ncbi:Uncharacterised protein [Vibrio cholerae]|nr:Uncharacterised protein [Vibrio cholerae]